MVIYKFSCVELLGLCVCVAPSQWQDSLRQVSCVGRTKVGPKSLKRRLKSLALGLKCEVLEIAHPVRFRFDQLIKQISQLLGVPLGCALMGELGFFLRSSNWISLRARERERERVLHWLKDHPRSQLDGLEVRPLGSQASRQVAGSVRSLGLPFSDSSESQTHTHLSEAN